MDEEQPLRDDPALREQVRQEIATAARDGIEKVYRTAYAHGREDTIRELASTLLKVGVERGLLEEAVERVKP